MDRVGIYNSMQKAKLYKKKKGKNVNFNKSSSGFFETNWQVDTCRAKQISPALESTHNLFTRN